MHIGIQGRGPDLVLIHGWAMHSGIFAPLTRLLIKRFRVHLVDLPGHGYSPESDDAFDLVKCAQQIAQTAPSALWAGWSLGGQVSLVAALSQFTNVRALVMIASSPRFVFAADWQHGVAPEIFMQFTAGLRHDYRRTIERFLALETHGSDEARTELRELKARVFERGEPALRTLYDGLRILESTDLRNQLPALTVPSLWIAGRRDKLISADAMRWAAEHSPGGRYLEISAGHAPFISHASEVADAMIDFAREASG